MPANPMDDDDDPPMRPRANMEDTPPVTAPPKLPPPKPPVSSPPVNSTANTSVPNSMNSMNSGMGGMNTMNSSMNNMNNMNTNNNSQATQFFGQMMANQAANPQKEEHWVKSYWRPAAAWLYMLICFVDFVVFPALTMVLPALLHGMGMNVSYTPWTSLSLQNGGFIHLSFAAILGVAAWTRGNEKVAKVNHS